MCAHKAPHRDDRRHQKVSRETNDASKFVRDPHRQAPLDQVQPIRTERGEGGGGGSRSAKSNNSLTDDAVNDAVHFQFQDDSGRKSPTIPRNFFRRTSQKSRALFIAPPPNTRRIRR